MKSPSILAGLISTAAASVVIRNPTVEEAAAEGLALALPRRALPNAPNGYTPEAVDCPAVRPTIRNATGLSSNETEWLQLRRNYTVNPMKTLLARLNITGLDTDAYIDSAANNVSALPNIAIAVSGGGYRALMNAAGAVAAFDDRSANSTSPGQLGGLLQSSTYLAGLSGGSWMVGSLFTNNFTSVQNILDLDNSSSGALWQFGNSILEGPDAGSIQLLDSAEYYKAIYDDVQGKNDAGYNTTITDYWGRALSYQLVNASNGGPAYTFSSIALQDWFTSGSVPMPLFTTDGRQPGELVVDGNATVYEVNPWELGTFDPTTYGFVPIEYLGTNFTAGEVVGNQQCVRGFDNVGFIMGTSSSLFNQAFLSINGSTGILNTVLTNILADIGEDDDDIADYPNPFYHFNNATNPVANIDQLTLVDGGEDLQNIPLHPLIQPVRHVDVIFAVDSSADTVAPYAASWPNGTALVATYARTFLDIANGTSFPSVPDQNTFVNLGLNNRPTMFGCDPGNTTSTTPLIVYLPNAPYSYQSNVSTYDLEYEDAERNFIINNGWDVATQGNSTIDPMWPTCVGCAILSRSLNRTNTPVPDVCTQCFNTYCWDGTINSTRPADYSPDFKVAAINVTSAASGLAFGSADSTRSTMTLVAALAVAAWQVL
ncbi:hypothetical protein AAFC00_000516 [Neodothiora populina]|uniref:Lysophospholipase n=1 Tax=Neodothiora populina TaxID=2781224 RepID=A0ABR3PD73_9PEZI